MNKSTIWWFLMGILVALGSGCEPNYPPINIDVPVTVPLCTAVSGFGNGNLCFAEDGTVDLGQCGVVGESGCSPGRLCFDNPLFLSCACETSADCEAFTAYVNTARGEMGQDLLEPLCDLGACVGDLDIPEEE